MSIDEQYDAACWLIERYDNLRSLVSNRASIIVSADALLLAGITFLLDHLIGLGNTMAGIERTILFAVVGLVILLLSISLFYAVSAIAFVWTTGRKATGFSNEPVILFFSTRETLNILPTTELFAERFKSTTKEQMTDYALAELLLVSRIHQARYGAFRWSLRFLQMAVPPFLVAILLTLLQMI